MIHHRLFPKGEYCHALISSRTHPNVLIQVRALIYDVHMDEYNPQYSIKIVKFYDDLNFLKRYFIGFKFQKDFKNKDHYFKYKRELIKTREDLEHKITESNILITADSVMCTKTLTESTNLFKNIQSFLIEKSIRDIYDMSTRIPYKNGNYSFKNRDEFKLACKRFLKDRFEVTDEWLEELTTRATFDDLDAIDF